MPRPADFAWSADASLPTSRRCRRTPPAAWAWSPAGKSAGPSSAAAPAASCARASACTNSSWRGRSISFWSRAHPSPGKPSRRWNAIFSGPSSRRSWKGRLHECSRTRVDHYDSPLPGPDFAGHCGVLGTSGAVPFHAKLFTVRAGGDPPSWPAHRLLARSPSIDAMPSLGRLRRRPGAGSPNRRIGDLSWIVRQSLSWRPPSRCFC
jgi:hypothetical protein